MTRIEVVLGDRSYPVLIEAGLLTRAGEHLAPLAAGRPLAIIADANVAPHLATLTAALDAAGIAWRATSVAAGEASKSWATLAAICDQLLAWGVERRDVIIALGGGVVGDLVGFAAAILKRGARFVQIPTTLLAQVDSSVGGKTGINTAAGKNLVGAFHQPELVLIDPLTLDTLPARELAAGYAEVVKYGLIDDADFFAWCENNGAALLAGDATARAHAIAHAVAAKARIVAADEFETNGTRALLNLGHTFGHALEAAAGFDGSLLHGESVAAGCALAFSFSACHRDCPDADVLRLRRHLAQAGLPNSLAATGVRAGAAELVAHMRHDKKASGGALPFLLAHGIGRTYLDRSADLAEVEAFLDAQPR
ncbi:3-dehydroquinate synthase [Sphingomonas sp.]|uniref:3-dehydroquinate synthase n=1 Tax=Sphingomonas sp. TaxID=28214 RepID=UPI003CC65670